MYTHTNISVFREREWAGLKSYFGVCSFQHSDWLNYLYSIMGNVVCIPPIDIYETAHLVVVPAPLSPAPYSIEQMIDRQRVCVIGAVEIITEVCQ